MRYLAILKDSLLESIDAKVLYVMGAVFLIMTLLASCISFRPMTMEEKLKQGIGLINFILDQNAKNQGQKPIQFELANFQQTNDSPDPWNGDYRFQMLMKYPPGKDTTQQRTLMRMLRGMARMSGTPSDPVRPFLQGQAPWLIISDVKEEPGPNPETETYAIVTKGTKITNRTEWPHEPSLFFGALPLGWTGADPSLGQGVFFIQNWVVNGIGAWAVMIIGVIITGFFVPNMLRKGSIDLLLSKPVNRPMLLLVKYLGGLLFVFLSLAGVVLGIWVMLGIRTGLWPVGFLVSIPVLTFYFAVLYSVSVLCSVITRSPIVSILASLGVWLLLFGLGFAQNFVEGLQRGEENRARAEQEAEKEGEEIQQPPFRLSVPKWVKTSLDAVELVLPRFRDLDRLTRRSLGQDLLSADERRSDNLDDDKKTNWFESLGVSTAFIVLILGLACWRFAATDY